MTPAAIVRDYKEAKDKRAQIQILADMNICEKKEIEKFYLTTAVNSRTPKYAVPKGGGKSLAYKYIKPRQKADAGTLRL